MSAHYGNMAIFNYPRRNVFPGRKNRIYALFGNLQGIPKIFSAYIRVLTANFESPRMAQV